MLPNGHVGPGLYVTLRVLGAPVSEAATWSGIADALSLPEGRKAQLDGPVPLAAPAPAPGGREQPAGGALQQLLVGGSAHELLRLAVQDRRRRYPEGCEASDAEELAELERGAGGRVGDGAAAHRAALLLRRGELALLDTLLQALGGGRLPEEQQPSRAVKGGKRGRT